MADETPKDETSKPADETAENPEASEVVEAAETTEAEAEVEATEESDTAVAESDEAAAESVAEESASDVPAAEEEHAPESPAAEEKPAEEEPAEEDAAPSPEAAEPSGPAMPEHTYEELHAMTVAQLREVAAGIEHDAVHGYTTMHKEHLVPAICTALGIEAHEHHEVVGINKKKVKAQIRQLKKERDAAEQAGDKTQLKRTRRRIRGLKRKIRKATV